MDFITAHSGTIVSVLFFTMFTGIALWAYWPANKQRLQELGNIPFREESHGQ